MKIDAIDPAGAAGEGIPPVARQSCSRETPTGRFGSMGAAPRSEAEQVPEGETRLVGTAAPLPLTVTSLRVGGLGAVCAC